MNLTLPRWAWCQVKAIMSAQGLEKLEAQFQSTGAVPSASNSRSTRGAWLPDLLIT